MDGLVRIRPFPAVVHPRHAREVLAQGDGAALAAWVGGYAITVPEHRLLLEDLLAAQAWGRAGQAVLVNGLYGTGKSHLLVLLHLLAALPAAWDPFLAAHPTFRRYATALQAKRPLVAHFALDEYGPRVPLEEAVGAEIARALGMEPPAAASRLDAWAGLMDAVTAAGHDGLLLLVDELSLFLAGKSPAAREADAAFLQFLAGWTARAPVWLIGALQRHLSDVGPLRSHSWRQVEDRFRRYTLAPQQLGDVLRERLLERPDPAAVRGLVAEVITPAAERHGLTLSASELQAHWPFHPEAVALLLAVVNGHLSPHRSAVEIVQRLSEHGLLDRPPARLITPLDLGRLLDADLRQHVDNPKLWRAAALLEDAAARTPDPALARDLLALLILLHLAERTATVAQLRRVLFDGTAAPASDALSAALHALRRQGAYLAVVRDADPAAETFSLAVDDDAGALARALMEARRAEFTLDDPRILEAAFQAGDDPAWPLGGWPTGLTVHVPWHGSDRPVHVSLFTDDAAIMQTSHDAATVLALLPDQPLPAFSFMRREPGCLPADAQCARVGGLWSPRPPSPAEGDLLAEYAAWTAAAEGAVPAGTGRERAARARCRERAEELRPAVAAALRALYLEGSWTDTRGEEAHLPAGPSLAAVLGDMLESAFDARYPLFPLLAPHGAPPPAAVRQLLLGFIEPGVATIGPQSLLGDYLERFAAPLGCVAYDGAQARVTPPRWEVLEPLLNADAPLRLPDALLRLQEPPLGLTPDLARLAVLAAVRSGALQGLDAFLQPLDPEAVPLGHSDAVAFVAAPTAVSEAHRPLVEALAERWEIPAAPWPIPCSQVLRRLQAWGRAVDVPSLREMMTGWSDLAGVMPWAWDGSTRALATVERLRTEPGFAPLVDNPAALDFVERLRAAACWWTAWRARLPLLLPREPSLRELLVIGEGGDLGALAAEAARAWETYAADYRRWHAAAFGPEVVAALRAVFDAPAFRAVKQLARLPVAPPEAATRALEALAQARSGYCPGLFGRFESDGVCGHCRLPLDAPSPMPDPAATLAAAEEAQHAYADLLARGPWANAVRARLPRAPETVAAKVKTLLAWRPDADPALDDATLAWLTRDDAPRAVRAVTAVETRLQGRDLTLTEARQAVEGWLNPDGELGDGDVVRFE
jgi:hypothetical protein